MHINDESWCTHSSFLSCICMPYMNESCLTRINHVSYGWVTWLIHRRHTNTWVMVHTCTFHPYLIWISHVAYGWVTSLILLLPRLYTQSRWLIPIRHGVCVWEMTLSCKTRLIPCRHCFCVWDMTRSCEPLLFHLCAVCIHQLPVCISVSYVTWLISVRHDLFL